MANRVQMKATRKPIEAPVIRAFATSVKHSASTVTVSFRYEDDEPAIIRVEMPAMAAAELIKQLRIKK